MVDINDTCLNKRKKKYDESKPSEFPIPIVNRIN